MYIRPFKSCKKNQFDEDKKVTDEDLKDKDQQILYLLQKNPTYTYAELAILLGVNKKTIVSRFKKLKNKKLVVRIGTSKKGYWEILK